MESLLADPVPGPFRSGGGNDDHTSFTDYRCRSKEEISGRATGLIDVDINVDEIIFTLFDYPYFSANLRIKLTEQEYTKTSKVSLNLRKEITGRPPNIYYEAIRVLFSAQFLRELTCSL
jgi:hypothetical protein